MFIKSFYGQIAIILFLVIYLSVDIYQEGFSFVEYDDKHLILIALLIGTYSFIKKHIIKTKK
ncbi:MAG: hypothetical protein HRT66_05570 [Flavobacteriaceae bacterium]|nr:hypothetical protein [Flavobacteriaceae bacterium]